MAGFALGWLAGLKAFDFSRRNRVSYKAFDAAYFVAFSVLNQ